MRIDILTLFPEMCDAVLGESIIGRARTAGKVDIRCHQIRDFAINRRGQVDDTPYGGGAGMLMMAQPIFGCFESVCREVGSRPHLIYLSPCGKTLTQERVKELAALDGFCLLCGHYEGVDQRVLDELVDEEISVGDYVVTGGELPAMILADAVSRLLPGVLSQPEGYMGESHYSSLLEYPQYTKPPVWHDRAVPEVLKNGHHAKIAQWQREQALLRTLARRPDLLETAELSAKDREFLRKIGENSDTDQKTVEVQ